jgi:hypothetical protein
MAPLFEPKCYAGNNEPITKLPFENGIAVPELALLVTEPMNVATW